MLNMKNPSVRSSSLRKVCCLGAVLFCRGALLFFLGFSPSFAGSLATLPGDMNGDGGVDISDPVGLLGFLFSSGSLAEFDCDGDGNANSNLDRPFGDISGDGQLNIADPIALLAFLFSGGPAPAPIQCTGGAPVVPTIAPGFDWSLPAFATPAANSGFFSEFADPATHVNLRVLDVTWRQLEPTLNTFSLTTAGTAQGMPFPSFNDQLAAPGDFWMRLWTSAEVWAPTWLPATCGVTSVGTDYDGQGHLPIWDPCVWNQILDVYREVFITQGLRSDPRLRFVYVPGAFNWCEFDFDIIGEAVASGALTHAQFDAWFTQAMADLVDIFNGENSDPTDDYAYKLVYTGEDYPFGPDTWGPLDDLYAKQAVESGMGIRNGITELFNFHLNHVPAYGTTIAPDGHMVTDPTWELFDGQRIIATENECYTTCGFSTTELEYAIVMSNLKALQLRVNWLYVVPSDSYLVQFAEHWEFVRRSLGNTATTSADAWVALRSFEDTYWIFDDAHTWSGDPIVRNFERWLTQNDIAPDAMSREGTDIHSNVLDPDNGTAIEGRRTDVALGQTGLSFTLDDAFLAGGPHAIEIKLTYPDQGTGAFVVEYMASAGATQTASVDLSNTGEVRTATFAIPDFVAQAGAPADFLVRSIGAAGSGAEDIELRFVRVVRAAP